MISTLITWAWLIYIWIGIGLGVLAVISYAKAERGERAADPSIPKTSFWRYLMIYFVAVFAWPFLVRITIRRRKS